MHELMRKISYWAKQHKTSATILIILLKLSLAIMALIFGTRLGEWGVLLSPSWYYLAGILCAVGIIGYPEKRKPTPVLRYYRQKSCDFLLGLSAFISLTALSNRPEASPGLTGNTTVHARVIKPSAAQVLQSLKENPGKKLSRQEKMILKKEFKKQLFVYGKAKLKGNQDEANKSGLILLTIIGALGLLFLVAALACDLSCSGSEAAAGAVAVIGGIGVIWAAIAIIRSINRKKPKKSDAVPSE